MRFVKNIALLALIGGCYGSAFGNEQSANNVIDRRGSELLFDSISSLRNYQERLAALAKQAANGEFPFNCYEMAAVKGPVLALGKALKSAEALPESYGDLWDVPKEPSPRFGSPGSCDSAKKEIVAKRETLIATLKSWQKATDTYAQSTWAAKEMEDTLEQSENRRLGQGSCRLITDLELEHLATEVTYLLDHMVIEPSRTSGCARAVSSARGSARHFLSDLQTIRESIQSSLHYISREMLLERAKNIDCEAVERQRQNYPK